MKKLANLCCCTLACALLVTCGSCDPAADRHGTIRLFHSNTSIADAALKADQQHLRTWEVTELSDSQELLTLKFVSKESGWIGGTNTSLYKTTDGGKVWQKVRVETPVEGDIPSLFFVDESRGWIVLHQYREDYSDLHADKAWLFRTDDAGRSWTLQYADSAVQIRRVTFINEREGWAVGRRAVPQGDIQPALCVLHTVDGGNQWLDVSYQANKAVVNYYGKTHDSAVDVKSIKPSEATLLTTHGRLLNTTDGGQTWHQITHIYTNPMITRLASTLNGSLSVVGGAAGSNRAFGMLIHPTDNGAWVKYVVEGVHLKDAFYLSDAQVIAGGYMLSISSKSPWDEEMNGVLYYSADNGRNWAILYRSTKAQSINALDARDGSHVWAVGSGGLVFRLRS